MYRVMYWIGRQPAKCDMKKLDLAGAVKLRDDYVERGYAAAVVSGSILCCEAESGLGEIMQEAWTEEDQ